MTLVTGYLGAGKTTLLTHILSNRSNLRVAALINDFAALNIDEDLVRAKGTSERVVELSNGCVCCHLIGDLETAVWDMLKEGSDVDLDQINYLLVETSGVSDPARIIRSLEAKFGKMYRARLDSVVTVIDADLISSWTATEDQGGIASAKRVDRLVEEVESVRATADTVIVYLHWGIETDTCPSDSQQELAQTLADAGADLVVGGHAHRVQGGGRLGTTFVGYGLGNFLFGAVSDESAKSGVLLVEVDGRDVLNYEWTPGRISDRVPIPLQGDEKDAAVDEWNELRDCTNLTE